MDNVFLEIRNMVSMPEVARFYGLEMNRSAMACCPFHDDHNPSLKVYDDHYYCFGCGATGDCTDFTARLFGISQMEAAKKLSYDFGLNLFDGKIAVPVKKVVRPDAEFKAWIKEANIIVSDYCYLLNRWRTVYAPKNQTEILHPLFVESLDKMDYTEYLADVLSNGSDEDKRDMFLSGRLEIEKIKKRVEEYRSVQPPVKRKAI